MLTIRFITAGAVLVMAVTVAAAQSSDAAKPAPLLQILTQPATTTTTTTTTETTTAERPHVRALHRHAARRRTKKSHEHEDAEQTEPTPQTDESASAVPAAAPPAASSVWTAGGAMPLPGVAADATAPTVIPTVDQNLSAVVVGGHTVQISTPDEFNAIDLAADHQPQADAGAPAASSATAVPAPTAAVAESDDHARDVWYEELLATLGGALAAGVVAWFLVAGGSQQRMYG